MAVMIQENPSECPTFAKISQNLTACLGDFAQFEQNIQQIAEIVGIGLSQFTIDHLAVRVNEPATAEQWKALLLQHGRLLKESQVNGRPIALIELEPPLEFCGQSVSIIELPFPKGKIYPEQGWEHIEIVVPFEGEESVEQWVARLFRQYHLDQNEQLKIKVSQPIVAGERLPNPSIAISLKDATNRNFSCLKLHPYDINTIICSEIVI